LAGNELSQSQRSWIGQFVLCTKWRGTAYLADPDKHAEIVWQPLHDIPEDTVPYVLQAIENILNECPYSEFGWNESHQQGTLIHSSEIRV
jgi:hypothetical protein